MAFGSIAVAYIIFVLWLYTGWRKAVTKKGLTDSASTLAFSVVVPIRNEAENIRDLLLDLSQQTYSNDLFEVIVVDDNSEDNSIELIKSLRLPYTLTVINSEGNGKKEALTQGIELAKNEVILTTDGDCRVGKGWIHSFANSYAKEDNQLVFGLVAFHSESTLFHHLQTIEFASLVGSGVATFMQNAPSMCNGANFSFKKSLFQELDGYQEHDSIPSGDDEFMMHKAYSLNKEAVSINMDQRGIVYTKPSDSLNVFFNQRKRWASKWGSYKIIFPKLLALVVFIFSFSFLASCLAFLMDYLDAYMFVTIVSAKVCLDFVFLQVIMRYLGKNMNIGHYLILTIVYPLYVCLFGILGSFGKYVWKDRVH